MAGTRKRQELRDIELKSGLIHRGAEEAGRSGCFLGVSVPLGGNHRGDGGDASR